MVSAYRMPFCGYPCEKLGGAIVSRDPRMVIESVASDAVWVDSAALSPESVEQPELIDAGFRLSLKHRVFFTLFPVLFLLAGYGFGQGTTSGKEATYEVASIRPSNPSVNSTWMQTLPDMFKATGVTTETLIATAYGLHEFQLVGGPNWLKSERYDITAKIDDATIDADRRLDKDNLTQIQRQRLQALLANRFRLKAHTGTKEMAIYSLAVARGGSKLQKDIGGNFRMSMGPGLLQFQAASISQLIRSLSGTVDSIVQDKTGLADKYDITLKWTPNDLQSNDSALPGLFTAIQEQLGLKLEPQKSPIEVLVIDSVEKPSAN